MDEQAVVINGTYQGDKPQIAITYVGLPAGVMEELHKHAWEIIAKAHAYEAWVAHKQMALHAAHNSGD